MTRIESVSVCPLDLPLREQFETALGTQETASNVLVRVETDTGVVGLGEGSPLLPVTGETQASAIAIARAAADFLATSSSGKRGCSARPLSPPLPEPLPSS